MSKPFRGMSQPQMNHLRPDIVLIEYSDPGAEEFRLSTNTYALLNSGRMLLVDTNISSLLSFVRQLSDDGFSPAALVISHRHVVGLGDVRLPPTKFEESALSPEYEVVSILTELGSDNTVKI
jgi:hypothetical protein